MARIILMIVTCLAMLQHPRNAAHLTVFVMSDCPLSNFYAPDVQRLCAEYRERGLGCLLAYEDVGLDETRMRAHLDEYGYREMPAVIDSDRAVARRAGATVTPQAVLRGADGAIRYRGRIDNRYESLGPPRRVVTERNLLEAIEAVLSGKPVPVAETPVVGCYIVSPEVSSNAFSLESGPAAPMSRPADPGRTPRLPVWNSLIRSTR